MTRGVDSEIISNIEAGTYAPAFLIVGEFEDSEGVSDPLYLWTGIGTLPYDGNDYVGTGSLLTIEGLQEILDVVSRGLTVTLDGIGTAEVNGEGDSILDLAYRTEYQNRPFTLSLCLIDLGDRSIIGTPQIMFSGLMDVMDPQEDGEIATITLTVENALVALERPVGRTYTSADQKERYPDDTFFDQMPELQNMEIQLDGNHVGGSGGKTSIVTPTVIGGHFDNKAP